MEGFIRNRLSDPRFNSRPVYLHTGNETTNWAPAQAVSVRRVNASAPPSYDKKSTSKKRPSSPKKRDDSGADSGSESDNDGEKPKKKKKKSDSDGGKKKCDCWEGYKRVPGTAPCSEGSCEKA
jgi:hypothetical protein